MNLHKPYPLNEPVCVSEIQGSSPPSFLLGAASQGQQNGVGRTFKDHLKETMASLQLSLNGMLGSGMGGDKRDY